MNSIKGVPIDEFFQNKTNTSGGRIWDKWLREMTDEKSILISLSLAFAQRERRVKQMSDTTMHVKCQRLCLQFLKWYHWQPQLLVNYCVLLDFCLLFSIGRHSRYLYYRFSPEQEQELMWQREKSRWACWILIDLKREISHRNKFSCESSTSTNMLQIMASSSFSLQRFRVETNIMSHWEESNLSNSFSLSFHRPNFPFRLTICWLNAWRKFSEVDQTVSIS